MLQIRGKLGNFCCKSGASWVNFVVNQGQVGKFLLQIRGKWIFFAGVIPRCARALARERNGCLC